MQNLCMYKVYVYLLVMLTHPKATTDTCSLYPYYSLKVTPLCLLLPLLAQVRQM